VINMKKTGKISGSNPNQPCTDIALEAVINAQRLINVGDIDQAKTLIAEQKLSKEQNRWLKVELNIMIEIINKHPITQQTQEPEPPVKRNFLTVTREIWSEGRKSVEMILLIVLIMTLLNALAAFFVKTFNFWDLSSGSAVGVVIFVTLGYLVNKKWPK